MAVKHEDEAGDDDDTGMKMKLSAGDKKGLIKITIYRLEPSSK